MIYYSIAMAVMVGVCVHYGYYGMAAFSFTVMVGTLLSTGLAVMR